MGRIAVSAFLAAISAFSAAIAVGNDHYARGTEWPKLESPVDWAKAPEALLTPEHAILLVAACARDAESRRLISAFEDWRNLAAVMRATVDPVRAKIDKTGLGIGEVSHLLDLLLSGAAGETNRPVTASDYFRRCERPLSAAIAQSWPSLKPLLPWGDKIADEPKAARIFAERICRPESPHHGAADPRAWAVLSAQRLLAEIVPPAGQDGKRPGTLRRWLERSPKGSDVGKALEAAVAALPSSPAREQGTGVPVPEWYPGMGDWARRASGDGEQAWRASLAAIRRLQRLAETNQARAEAWLSRAAWVRLGRKDPGTALQDELPAIDYGKEGDAYLEAFLPAFLSGAPMDWPPPPNGGLPVSVLGDPGAYRALSRALDLAAPERASHAPSCAEPLRRFVAAATKVPFGKIERLDPLLVGPVVAARLRPSVARPRGDDEAALWLGEGNWLQWAAGDERVTRLSLAGKTFRARLPSGHVFFAARPALLPATRNGR